MAKKSQIARDKKRENLISFYKKIRDELRTAQKNENLSLSERQDATSKLAKLPRDSSPTRLTSRCQETGTTRSVYRKFKLNRISFRKNALEGLLPGVTKSSW